MVTASCHAQVTPACTLRFSGLESAVLRAAIEHAVSAHRETPGESLERELRAGLAEEEPSQLAAHDALARRLSRALNDRACPTIRELFGAQSTVIDMPSGRRFLGEEGVARLLTEWSSAFGDGRVEIVRVLPSLEGATVEFVFRGRQTGALDTMSGRVAATGSLVELNRCDVMGIAGERIVRLHSYYDAATLLVQLGVAGIEGERQPNS